MQTPTRKGFALTDEQRAELERRVRSALSSERLRLRAEAILLASEGLSDRAITRLIGLRHEHVGAWRRRFLAEGIDGLLDRPRPGRPVVYGPEARAKVLEVVQRPPPDPPGYWTFRRVAETVRGELGISQSQARRILLGAGQLGNLGPGRRNGVDRQRSREKAPVA